jgi:hypothetical protein
VSAGGILFWLGIGLGALVAALLVWAQVRSNGWRSVSWGMVGCLLGIGLLFGGCSYWLDSDLAGTTLFEVVAPGAVGVAVGDPAPVRTYDIAVEHPGVRHELLVDPLYGLGDPPGPAELHVRLEDGAGRALVDEPLVLPVDCSGRGYFCEWATWTGSFVPETATVHRLVLTVRTVEVPEVHLRVEDPENTDGVRAPGY